MYIYICIDIYGIQCRRAWSAGQVDPEGWCASCRKDKPEDADRNDIAIARHIGLLVRSALPEKLNSIATGGDVKETVMTIPFLRTSIINPIADLENKITSHCNKRRHWRNPKPHGNGSPAMRLVFPFHLSHFFFFHCFYYLKQ